MPLAVGPDPQNPGQWIWIDKATGQPASQPGGPGTKFIAQSDPPDVQQSAPGPTGAPQGPYDTPAGPGAPGTGSTPKVAGQTGSTIQQVVNSLGPDWTLKDPQAQPVEETIVATVPNDAVPGTTQTVNRGTGNYYVVVKNKDGVERALFLKADASKDGKVARQSGINDQGDDAANVYSGDLRDLSWTQSKPLGDIPNQPKQPSPTSQLDRLDANGKVIPPGDTTTKPVQLRDAATGTVIDIPKDPAGAVTKVGNGFYVVKPDGSATPVTDSSGKPVTEDSKPDVYNVPGIGLVQVDPTKPAGQNATTLVSTPTGMTAKDLGSQATKTINGQVWVASDGPNNTITWSVAKDTDGNPLPADITYTMASNDPRSKFIQLIGSDGSTKTVRKPPDWTPPPNPQAGNALTPDSVSPFVVTIGDNGQPVFTKNQNQVSISEAQKQLIQQLGLKVADGSMSEKDAQDLIASTTQAMTAQAAQLNAQANAQQAQNQQLQGGVQAGQAITQGLTQGAQAGAQLISTRVNAANQMLGNVLGMATQGGAREGNLQGGIMAAPAGLGENLVQGIQGWTADLGGGQGTYDAAANMVKAADPTNSTGMAAQGYAALQQMLQKYQDLTGQMHPAAAVAQQSGLANTGFAAPATTGAAPAPGANLFNPQASTAALNAAGYQDTPQGRAAAAAANPALLQTPAPMTPRPVAAPAPIQPFVPATVQPGTYGIFNSPMPAFVAPTTVTPTLPTVQVS